MEGLHSKTANTTTSPLMIPSALINPFKNKTKLNDYLLGDTPLDQSLENSQLSSLKNSTHLTSRLDGNPFGV